MRCGWIVWWLAPVLTGPKAARLAIPFLRTQKNLLTTIEGIVERCTITLKKGLDLNIKVPQCWYCQARVDYGIRQAF